MICIARAISFLVGEAASWGISSMSSMSTTSSAKRSVDMASAPCSGRTAVRYCLLRMTTVPMPTCWDCSMAAANRA